jgi:hypothetical protein
MNEEECVNPTPCPSTPKPILDFTDPAPASELKWDWETVCLSNDGGVTKLPGIAVYSMLDPQNPSSTLYISTTDVTATHTIVSCDLDRETVESCYQLISDPSVRFKRINILDVSVTPAVVIETIWLDDNGDSVAAPAGVEPCSDPVKSVESVCDVISATITGDITYTITGAEVALSGLTTLTFTNDTARYFWTDFGNGFSDVGPLPSAIYNDGHYEIKTYAVMTSGNKILIATKELDVVGGVITVTGANPQPVVNSYPVSVGTAKQEYSGSTPVGTPKNPDGSDYTVQGTLAWNCPAIIDDLEDNGEWNPEEKADLVECTTIIGANTVTEGTDANLIAASEVVTGGGGTITPYHTMLGNPGLNLAGTASGGGGAIVGGLNVNVGTAITGAQFTYTVNVGSDSDPGDPADLAVVVWDNVAGTSIAATSIVTSLPYVADAQGTGLNCPIYGYPNPVTNPYTIVWTGDLPVGDYTVVFLNQNQGITDNVTVSIAHNIVAGGTPVVTKAQLMALDECTIAALTPEPVIPPIEVPGGAIIVNTAALSVIAPTNVRSFSVKSLANKTYDISFDSGTNWLNTIDGGDSWGEGNEYQIDISQVLVRPTVSGDRVFIHWEVI